MPENVHNIVYSDHSNAGGSQWVSKEELENIFVERLHDKHVSHRVCVADAILSLMVILLCDVHLSHPVHNSSVYEKRE